MTLSSSRKSAEITEELTTRLRRQLFGLVTVLAAIGAGWLGIIIRPYLGQIALCAFAIALIWVIVVTAIDTFRDR